MVKQFLSCPYCPCTFVAESDLDKHLVAFGQFHEKDFKEMHEKMQKEFCPMEFNEVDKAVREFEKIIREHYGLDQKKNSTGG